MEMAPGYHGMDKLSVIERETTPIFWRFHAGGVLTTEEAIRRGVSRVPARSDVLTQYFRFRLERNSLMQHDDR